MKRAGSERFYASLLVCHLLQVRFLDTVQAFRKLFLLFVGFLQVRRFNSSTGLVLLNLNSRKNIFRYL